MDVGIRKIIALSVGALSLTALAACGSLQTAAVSSTPNAAQATATAFFDNVNTKRALSSEPTFYARHGSQPPTYERHNTAAGCVSPTSEPDATRAGVRRDDWGLAGDCR